MKCNDCGYTLREGSIVCPECGTVVASDINENMRAVLINRAFIYLEDGEFDKAAKCLDAVIACAPENAKAYLGRLLADLRVNTPAELARYNKPFDKNKYFIKAYECADAELKAELDLYAVTRTPRKERGVEPPRPTEVPKPVEPSKPIEVPKPLEPPKPIEPQKPVEAANHQSADTSEKKANRAPIIVLFSMIGLIILCVVLLFILCRSNIKVLSSDASLGSVSGGGSYWAWENATITAIPAEGCSFESWNDGNTDNPRVVYPRDGSFYKAVFSAVPSAKINLSVGGGKGDVKGAGTYKMGAVVEIEAIPDGDSEFLRWNDGSTSAKRRIQVSDNVEYTAYFSTGKMFRVDATSANKYQGSVSGSGSYNEGAEITVKATPASGYIFAEWSDGNTNAERKITVSKDVSITATFASAAAVARIDNVYYTDVEDAIYAAKNLSTVTLLKDVKLYSPIIIKNKSLTIDGRGNALTLAGISEVISFSATSSSTTLTLKNLIIENTATVKGSSSVPQCLAIYDGGSVKLEDCVLEVKHTDGQAIKTSGRSSAQKIEIVSCDIQSGNIGIDLGTYSRLSVTDNTIIEAGVCIRVEKTSIGSSLELFDSSLICNSGVAAIEVRGNDANTNIYDCEIFINDKTSEYVSYLLLVYNETTSASAEISGYNTVVTLNGGAALFGSRAGSSGKFSVSGGTYNTATVNNYVAAGHKAVKNTDGTWTVK